MQKYIIVLFAAISFLAACSKGGGIISGGTKGGNGVSYKVHTSKGGEKAKVGDFLTLNLQYATQKDSVIFSSYNKPKPLSFKFQPTLFKGVLNEGLAQMGAGDSATFLVPTDSLYGQRMPKFLKSGENIKYTISLLKVQSQTEYQQEKMREREADTSKRAVKLDPKQLKGSALPSKLQRAEPPAAVTKKVEKPNSK
jgi:FKBP-type peptidyl-prolyl cis-trans isomerase FkpA